MTRFRRLPVAFAVAALLGVAAPAAASATSTLTISGATASYPLIQLLAQKYQKLHPHKIKFKIAQGGSSVGENDVIAGRVSIGDLSRRPLSSAPAGLVAYPIAKYPICVITNKANTLTNLTGTQLTSIFNGKTKTWSQVPGASVSGSIEPITPNLGRRRPDELSGTAAFAAEDRRKTHCVDQIELSGRGHRGPDAPEGREQSELDRVRIRLPGDKGTVNVVGFNGVACTLANATSEQYAGVASFYELTKGKAKGAASAFIGWIKVSAAAQEDHRDAVDPDQLVRRWLLRSRIGRSGRPLPPTRPPALRRGRGRRSR